MTQLTKNSPKNLKRNQWKIEILIILTVSIALTSWIHKREIWNNFPRMENAWKVYLLVKTHFFNASERRCKRKIIKAKKTRAPEPDMP